MLRKLIMLAFLLGFSLAGYDQTIPDLAPQPIFNLYLPLVIDKHPLAEAVALGDVDWIGYPGYVCIYGYTTSLTSSAVYSATVAIEVTTYPYCEPPEVCPPSTGTATTRPILTGTLPDQKNPFSYCMLYTKGYYSYGRASLASANENPPGGKAAYALTISNVTKEGSEWDTVVSGIATNDSSRNLGSVRVVGIAGLCEPKEAELNTTTLAPGESIDFTFTRFYCSGGYLFPPPVELLELSAQGIEMP